MINILQNCQNFKELWPIIRVICPAFLNELFNFFLFFDFWYVWSQILMCYPIHYLGFLLIFISLLTGKYFPHDNSKCINISFSRSYFISDEFWSHLRNCADCWRFLFNWNLLIKLCLFIFLNSLRNTKITQFDLVILVDQNILNFQISVKNRLLLRMKIQQSFRDFNTNFLHFLWWQMNRKFF